MSKSPQNAIIAKQSSSIAIINNQSIVVAQEKGNQFISIKPICDAIGVDFSAQLQRVKRDDIKARIATVDKMPFEAWLEDKSQLAIEWDSLITKEEVHHA